MSRGNARQRIFRDARDYQRLCEGLEQTVERFGFEILSFVCLYADPGYDHRDKRVRWVVYEALYRAWRGEMGGSNVEAACRAFVDAGLAKPPANPFQEAVHGWLLGSQQFIDRIRRLMKEPKHRDELPSACRLANLPVETVIGAVAEYYGTTPAAFACRRSAAPGPDLAAWLARRFMSATLRELAAPFGLGHPDSVSNLVRRANEAVD